MNYTFERDDEDAALAVERGETVGDHTTLTVTLPDGTARTIQARRLPGDIIELRNGDRVFRVPLAQGENGAVSLAWQGETFSFTRAKAGKRAGKDTGKRSGTLVAPMTGVVAAVHVVVGETVSAYQPVVVVEAMKVLATLEAPFAGTVRAVRSAKGDRVEHGAVLVEIEPISEKNDVDKT
jgi:biotin carboxyl carrier protein